MLRILVPMLALAAAACATGKQPPPRDASAMTVEYTWEGVTPCTSVSPRMTVHGFPAATKRFRVELVDLHSAFGRHGGGEVDADPSGVIPAGALKDYRGPCPSQQAINYEMRVVALDAGGATLARAAERQTFAARSLPISRRGRR